MSKFTAEASLPGGGTITANLRELRIRLDDVDGDQVTVVLDVTDAAGATRKTVLPLPPGNSTISLNGVQAQTKNDIDTALQQYVDAQ